MDQDVQHISENWLQRLMLRMVAWRAKHIKENTFILILSFIVGLLTASAALLLKTLIRLVQQLLTSTFATAQVNYLYLVYPAIGLVLTSLFVKYIVRDDIEHGVTKVLYAISQRKGRLKSHHMWTSMLASSITIGMGGSLGAEAPIVLTGSAIGSNLGRIFHMDHRTLMVLIGCGASGAIAGIFKAPIAGLVFTIEVLMLDLTTASVLPLLISSVTAASLSYFVTGTAPVFPFVMSMPFSLGRIPWVILLGMVCGLVSLYLIRGMNSIEGLYKRFAHGIPRVLTGAVVLGGLIFLFPPLYGEGYESITSLINGHPDVTTEGSLFYTGRDNPYLLLAYFACIVIFKVVASASTNGAGGVGGVFAPSLFIGCFTGYIVGNAVNLWHPGAVSECNFALMGMAGVMSGLMHAPLTGIFLIAELTGGYQLFLPLMIVSIVAYITIQLFEKYSIYSIRLAQKGELITHNKDKAVLQLMKIDQVLITDFDVLRADMMFGELIEAISKSRRNIFPVVDAGGKLVGQVQINDIRNIMFRTDLYRRFKIGKLMVSPPATLHLSDNMETVMKVFDDTAAWYLPVVDADGRYIGFASRTRMFNVYRQTLVYYSAE
ncbi:MAG: chloride channel protein [Bacteroidales bacterium]|nr:chloride channel protein [Bacteroidales bacterium]